MTIYQKLKKIAKPIILHYHADLTKHDLRDCRKMKQGDSFLWAARSHGTYLCRVGNADHKHKYEVHQSAINNLDLFDAYDGSVKSLQWYFIEATSKGYGHVTSITTTEARNHITKRLSA